MVKISVIVPVYNGEKHLTECMDSICGQTLQDIEIICVDDGSTDKSMQLLRDYQVKDNRIQIYQQDHKYAGVARNLGMTHATGEYMVFWDCDDFFNLQALEKLYGRAKNTDADVCVCGANQYIETKKELCITPSYLKMKEVPKSGTFNRYTNPEYYLDFTCAMAWNKLFKRSYIEQLDLNFESVRNGNDLYFTIVALGLADRIAVLDENLINYRIHQGSGLMGTYDKAAMTIIQSWLNVKEKLEKYEGFVERSFVNKALGSLIYMLSNLQTWDAFQNLVKALKNYGMKELNIQPQNKNYYYSSWINNCVKHLYQDTVEQLAIFFAYSRYIHESESKAELRSLRKEIRDCNAKIKRYEKEINELKTEESEIKSQLKETELDNRKLQQEINRIRNSWAFKTGKVITWIPSNIKKLITGGK